MSIYKGTDFVAGTPDLTNYATTRDINTLLSTLYPVGSIYIGTQSTCPLATLISGSTWVKVATSLVTDVSIPSTIAVYGNGKTLGLTDGTYTAGITLNNNYNNQETFDRNQYNKNIGTAVTSHSFFGNTNKGVGVVQNTDGTSGLIAKSDSITYAKLTVNVWQRTV